MEGTRSLDWHLHKLFIPIVRANPLQRTSMRNAPSQPHTGTRIPPFCLPLFSVLPTQKAFLKNSVQSLSHTQNQTTLFCCLRSGMDCGQLQISFGNNTSAQKNLRNLLPSDISALLLKLFEKLVNAFVGVHVFLPRRDEKSQK